MILKIEFENKNNFVINSNYILTSPTSSIKVLFIGYSRIDGIAIFSVPTFNGYLKDYEFIGNKIIDAFIVKLSVNFSNISRRNTIKKILSK